jgi:hypothetical protein
MASSTVNENRSMKVANDRYIYLLAVNVKHGALVRPILVDYRHILMAQESVSCVFVLHVGTPLGTSAVAVD